ncbi:MAG: hypothetical protein ABI823_15040 [Bryobacteraceae bacterium]
MKATIGLILGLALGGALQAEKLQNGLEFRTPLGWTVKSNGDAAALLPSDMAMEPGGSGPAEIYLIGLEESISDVREARPVVAWLKNIFPAASQIRLAVPPQAFRAAGGNGTLFRFDAVSQGTTLGIHVYAVGLSTGGAAGLIAVARPEQLATREGALAGVANSLSRPGNAGASQSSPSATYGQTSPAPARGASGPLAAQWEQKLRGHKLHQFSSSSSGYGSGGYNSQKTLFLGANGNYAFSKSGSVSVYVDGANGGSSSQGGDQGRWRVYEQGGKVLLELVSPKSGTETIVLTNDGTKTLLNGRRWLVGD